MALSATIKKLESLLHAVSNDLKKAEKGNSAASQRVRTGTIKLEKVAKLYRKESVSAGKKTKKKATKKKATKKKAAKRKVAKKKAPAKRKTTAKRRVPAKAKAPARRKTKRKATRRR